MNSQATVRRARLHGIVGLLICGFTSVAGLAHADVVLDWNVITMSTVSGENPFAQARFVAITHVAVFEAVNAITGDDEPYLGTITAPPGASAEAAVVAAADGVLENYFPSSAASLDAARTESLAAIPDGQSKDDGISVGEAAAAAMIANRASDGSAPPQFYTPPSANPGEWQLTPGCPAAGGILLQWRNVTPFGVQSSDQFRPGPPPALTSGKYTNDYNEVKRVGALDSTERPQDRADVARYFAAAPAPHVWNQALRQVSVAESTSLSENARAFALLNMAISDALVSVMETKYHYVFWRPITAIRAGDSDDNPRTEPDPVWTPFIVTPCFPSYPSAHASASNAARTIAEKIFGSGPHDITLSHPAVPDVILHYTRFQQITDDIDDARVYGGIHFRFDQEVGGRLGRRVGSYVYRNNLRRRS
ncbi:MAG TPA: vanadium-dependent haloperoxidase [Candidatus Binatia bacterium]|nr:vanadium-dependent haloperoxidase [Candidatus Binatia bacterium]